MDNSHTTKTSDHRANSSGMSDRGVAVTDTGAEVVVLRKEVGVLGGIGLVLGMIIGSGIFVSPIWIVMRTGSEGLTLTLWAIGGVMSLLGSLSLAELGSVIPKSAGEYNYLRTAYAKWVGFMFAWNEGLMLMPSSQAISAMTCASYILVPVYSDGCGEAPQLHLKMLAAAILLFLAACNAYSVKLSNRINIIFTAAKVIALIIIVVGGIVQLAQGKTQYLKTGFEGSNKQVGEIIMGFYSAMYAYSGWNTLNSVIEEIDNPKRNIPLVFYISLPLVTVLYLLVNVSYFTVMSTEDLLASPAVAITWAEIVMPAAYWLMPICVAISTFGAANSSLFSIQRLYYVLGREGEAPQIMSYIHHQKMTPLPAVCLNTVLSIMYVLLGDVASLIDFLSFSYWMFVTLIQLSVIILRFTMKDAPRTYKVPLVFPIIVFVFGAVLVIVPLVDAPQIEFLYATLLMLASMLFYVPIVVCDNRARCMRYITQFFQQLLEVVPAEDTDADTHNKVN